MSALALPVDASARTPRSPALAAVLLQELGHNFETFTMWCFALHLAYAGLLLTPQADLARAWLFPLVHFNAWAVLAGSHALIYFVPDALHAPRIARYRSLKGRGFELLLAHEALHLLPPVLLCLVGAARPLPGLLPAGSLAMGTVAGVLLGSAYLAWQLRRANVYEVSVPQLKSMALVAVVAGVAANAMLGFHL